MKVNSSTILEIRQFISPCRFNIVTNTDSGQHNANQVMYETAFDTGELVIL